MRLDGNSLVQVSATGAAAGSLRTSKSAARMPAGSSEHDGGTFRTEWNRQNILDTRLATFFFLNLLTSDYPIGTRLGENALGENKSEGSEDTGTGPFCDVSPAAFSTSPSWRAMSRARAPGRKSQTKSGGMQRDVEVILHWQRVRQDALGLSWILWVKATFCRCEADGLTNAIIRGDPEPPPIVLLMRR